jgi:hypothetical protein
MTLELRNGRRVVAGGRMSRADRVLVEGGHRAPVSWPGARCDWAFSAVDGVPGRLAALDADAAEGHVGEVEPNPMVSLYWSRTRLLALTWSFMLPAGIR